MSGAAMREALLISVLFGWACGNDTVGSSGDAGPGDGGLSDASGGDGRPVYASQESQYCSSADRDDPYYVCGTSQALVCINTYTMTIPLPEGPKTVVPYLCRSSCVPGDGTCRAADVCCPGTVYGVTYGKAHGCVPPEFCDHPPSDAGARD